MRLVIFALVLASIVAGCATVNYQPYEGNNKVYQGEGGTKVVVDGIDFWANGSPPRRYAIIGMVESAIGAGIGAEGIIRTAVANEVKKQGGNAAVQVDDNTSFSGIIRTAPGAYMAANKKTMKFAIVRYVP